MASDDAGDGMPGTPRGAGALGRRLDPAHDMGLVQPRADTLDPGDLTLSIALLVNWTVSYGVAEDTQISLHSAPLSVPLNDELLVMPSVKHAFVRTDRVIVSGQAALMYGTNLEDHLVRLFGGALIDVFLDDAERWALHGQVYVSPLTGFDTLDGYFVPEFVTVVAQAGASWLVLDWLGLMVDAFLPVSADTDEIAVVNAVTTPHVPYFTFPGVAGGVRFAGTRWSLDLGASVQFRPDEGPLALPILSGHARW